MYTVIHDTQKQYSLALVNYEDALKLYRAKYKTGHCLIATTLNNMGLVLMQKQGFSEALIFFEEALQIRKEQLGEDHADVGQIWHNLGLVHGKLALQKGHSSLFQAIECFKQALRIRLPCHGQVNLEVSYTWNNLGIAYKSLNDYDNAIGCFVKVIQIREKLLGCDHVEVGNANHNLGNLYAKAGNFSKALEAYEASYKTSLHTYGHNHLSIANTLHNMGNVYYRMGNKEKARDLYREALKIRDSNLSSSENSKADLANSLHKVAQLELEAGQYDIALTHFERSLELKRLVYGDSHIHLAATLKAVGWEVAVISLIFVCVSYPVFLHVFFLFVLRLSLRESITKISKITEEVNIVFCHYLQREHCLIFHSFE
jgi:tetratricopeptide (TPR) repeat protein